MQDQSASDFPIELSNYRIKKTLGEGGMATVYLAEQQQPRRDVVIKLISPDTIRTLDDDLKATFMARLRNEGNIAARFNHPNLVTVHESGVVDEHYYLVMEYLSGGDLRRRIGAGVEPGEAIRYLRDIAAALAKMHKLGLLHRDLKPENVLLHEDGHPVLIDFGIAQETDDVSAMTSLGLITGTPHYMAPERLNSEPIDERSDLYSLGVLAFELITGDVPFKGDNPLAIGYAHLTHPIPSLSDDLSRFQPIIDRLLAKQPQDRFQNAGSVIAALDELSGDKPPDRTQQLWRTTLLFSQAQGSRTGQWGRIY